MENTKNSILKKKLKTAEIGSQGLTATGKPATFYSREENKPLPVAPKSPKEDYRRVLAEVENGPSMTEKVTRGEWTSGMKGEIGRGVNRSKNLAKGPSVGAVAGEVKNTVSGIKDKLVRRAKKLYNDREQAQRNWEKRPNNSNYSGSWTNFKSK